MTAVAGMPIGGAFPLACCRDGANRVWTRCCQPGSLHCWEPAVGCEPAGKPLERAEGMKRVDAGDVGMGLAAHVAMVAACRGYVAE